MVTANPHAGGPGHDKVLLNSAFYFRLVWQRFLAVPNIHKE